MAHQRTQKTFDVSGVPKKDLRRDDFEHVNNLGKGGFGMVSLCRQKGHTQEVAIKRVSKTRLNTFHEIRQLKREISVQNGLRHQFILKFFGWFDDQHNVYMMLEPCSFGSLYKVLRKYHQLSPHRACYVVHCLADALQYCHDRNVIHRDLKPENVLLKKPFVPKLADFGWAVRTQKQYQQTLCGTPEYLSPEMLDFMNDSMHNKQVDNWALGVLFYECLFGYTPFYNRDQTILFQNIKSGIVKFPTTMLNFDRIPDEAVKIIKHLLALDPEQRYSLKKVRKNKVIRAQVAIYANNLNFPHPPQ